MEDNALFNKIKSITACELTFIGNENEQLYSLIVDVAVKFGEFLDENNQHASRTLFAYFINNFYKAEK